MEDNYKKILGIRLNTALAAANMKQKELAKLLGVTDNTISYFCSGKRIPNIEQIIQISKFLNVSTDFLLGLSDVKSTEADIKTICDYTGLNEKSISYLFEQNEFYKSKVKTFVSDCPETNAVCKTMIDTVNYFLSTPQGYSLWFELSLFLFTIRNCNLTRLDEFKVKKDMLNKSQIPTEEELSDIIDIIWRLENRKLPLNLRAQKSDLKESFDKLLNEVFIEEDGINDGINKEFEQKELEVYQTLLKMYEEKEAAENGNN